MVFAYAVYLMNPSYTERCSLMNYCVSGGGGYELSAIQWAVV